MHIAIIMDGNGRWATQRGLPRTAGHVEGAKAVRTVVETAARAGVDTLTLYAFSAANWTRPQVEIAAGQLRQFCLRIHARSAASSCSVVAKGRGWRAT